jgi:hypothetical protein
MQTFGLVIFTGLGMALIAGLSIAIHMMLPASMLERAAPHGRHSGLGPSSRPRGAAGGRPAIRLGILRGQYLTD